jgi:hypothetical protein
VKIHKLQSCFLCKTLIFIFGYFDGHLLDLLAAYAVREPLLKNEKEVRKMKREPFVIVTAGVK